MNPSWEADGGDAFLIEAPDSPAKWAMDAPTLGTPLRYVGDGTLLAVKEWSIDGVRAMYKELVAAAIRRSLNSTAIGIPAAKAQRPLDPQVVPVF